MIDVLDLVQHFRDHQEGDYGGYYVGRKHLDVSPRVDHYYQYQDEGEVNGADL